MYIAALFTIARTWKQHRCLSADEWTKKLCYIYMGFPGSSDSKESPYSAGDLGSIPGPRTSPGEGNGNPLQYSCLENPMHKGAWQASVHGVTKSWTQLRDFSSLHVCVCVCVCVCVVLLRHKKEKEQIWSVLMRWMKLEFIIQSEVSQKRKINIVF